MVTSLDFVSEEAIWKFLSLFPCTCIHSFDDLECVLILVSVLELIIQSLRNVIIFMDKAGNQKLGETDERNVACLVLYMPHNVFPDDAGIVDLLDISNGPE